MTEKITPKSQLVPLWAANEGSYLPFVTHEKQNDKYRDKKYTRGRQANQVRTAILAVGGKTRERLREKLDAIKQSKHSKIASDFSSSSPNK